MKKAHMPDLLFTLLIGSMYIYAVSAFILSATVINMHPTRIFAAGLITLGICMAVVYSRRTALAALGMALALGLFIWLSDAWENIFAHIEGTLLFVNGSVRDPETYGGTIVWWISFLLGLLTAVFLYKQFSFFLLVLCGVIPFALGGVMNHTQNMSAFLIFMFCFCALLIRKMNGYRHGAVAALLALPLCAVAIAGGYFIPRPHAQNNMHIALQKPINRVYDFMYVLFNPKYFNFQSTGFSGADGTLGGPVTISNRAVMEVETSGRLYLSGLTKNEYDGKRWTDTIKGDLFFLPEHFEETETVYISVINPTGTVFKPPRSRNLTFYNNKHDYNEHLEISPSGDIRSSRLLERATGYSFEYLPAGIPLNVGSDYMDSVYRHYTGLPETLPQRVYDLAHEITLSAAYGYEKLKAIEAYLIQFPYTLNPPPVPAEADFVDFFLFEASEGYCTYFASAMAVLSRCVGIPARYMEGYLMPPVTPEQNRYTITNANAHAWVEVYLEGYGWLIVEATAPFRPVDDLPQAASETSRGSLFAESFMGYSNYEEYLRSIGIDLNAAPPEYFWPEEALQAVEIKTKPRITIHLETFFLLLTALCFLYIWMQSILEKFRIWRVGKMPVNQQAQLYFKGILKMTAYYHYPMHENETPQRYALRLGKRFAFKSDTAFLRDLVVLYYKARYGTKPLTDRELNLMREAYFDMFRLLSNVRSKPRFMFIRYVRKITRV